VYWGYCTHVHAVRRAHCEHAIDTGYIRSRFLLACRRFGAAFAEPCCVASPQLRWTVYSAPLVAASLLGDSPACGIPCVASLHHSPQLNPTALAAMCASQTASAISRYCSPLPLPLATPTAARHSCCSKRVLLVGKRYHVGESSTCPHPIPATPPWSTMMDQTAHPYGRMGKGIDVASS